MGLFGSAVHFGRGQWLTRDTLLTATVEVSSQALTFRGLERASRCSEHVSVQSTGLLHDQRQGGHQAGVERAQRVALRHIAATASGGRRCNFPAPLDAAVDTCDLGRASMAACCAVRDTSRAPVRALPSGCSLRSGPEVPGLRYRPPRQRRVPRRNRTMAAGVKRLSFVPGSDDVTLKVCGVPRGT
jgi:hypothetical protein